MAHGWTPQSAQSFEQAVERLRERAEGFDLTIKTRVNSTVEAQGRTSGSRAFVRFVPLTGDRAALAALETQHTRLMQITDTMKSLLESIPFPVWLRDQDGSLNWVNQTYVKAVDADSVEIVYSENRCLLDASARALVEENHAQQRQNNSVSHYRKRLPVTAAGDRKTMDVSEVTFEGGSAGLAVDMSEVEVVQSNLRRTLESHAQTLNQLATAVAIFDEKRHLIFLIRHLRACGNWIPSYCKTNRTTGGFSTHCVMPVKLRNNPTGQSGEQPVKRLRGNPTVRTLVVLARQPDPAGGWQPTNTRWCHLGI